MAVDVTFLPGTSPNNIDTNFERTKEALQKVVGREGDLPNHMNADLDLNSNDILNVNSVQADKFIVDGKDLTDVVQEAFEQADRAEDAANDSRNSANQAAQSAAAAERSKDLAAKYASDAVSQGNVPIYDTADGMSALEVPAGINAIEVNGQATAGDGLGGKAVDTDNGTGVWFVSGGATARNWYRAADVNFDRMTGAVRADLSSGASPFLSARDTVGNGILWKNFGNFVSGYQTVVADEARRHMYVLQNSDTTNGPSTVSRWTLDGGRTPVQLDAQNASTAIGHQTLALIYGDDDVRLVGSTGPGASLGVTMFDYVAAGDPTNIVNYQLFETGTFSAATITACVSYDQNWLIARGLRSDGVNVARVFALSVFGAGGDYSGRYAYEFAIPAVSGPMPLQGIASDGRHIHFLYGGSSPSVNKSLVSYTLDGKLIGNNEDFGVGRADFDNIAGATHYEPEGMFWVRPNPGDDPVLAVCMIIGGVSGAAYSKRIYLMSPQPAEYSVTDRIQSAGRTVIGADQAVAIGTANHLLQVHGNNFENSTMVAVNWAAPGTSSGGIRIAKSKGGAPGTHGAVEYGDSLGSLSWNGDDGTTFLPSASIVAIVDATVGPDVVGGSLSLRVAPGGGTSPLESVRLRAPGTVMFPRIGTTASAANAYLNASSTPANELLRSTSSLAYKDVIEDISVERAEEIVMALRPFRYRSRAEADRTEWSWYGLGAEEVAKIDPRLVHWTYPTKEVEVEEVEEVLEPIDGSDEMRVTLRTVTRTETVLDTDADMIPDGVQYERISVIQNVVIKDLMDRANAMEAAIAALQSALAAKSLN